MGDSTGSSTTVTRRLRRRVTLLRRRGGELQYDGPTQICYCGIVAPLYTSWTDINPGRRFYSCQNYQQGRGCGFFQWHDDEMGERSIVVINELLCHVDNLYDENLRLRRGDEEEELRGDVVAELAGIIAKMKKYESRLRIALCVLVLTWVFMFLLLCCK